jgi:hypothetical protein
MEEFCLSSKKKRIPLGLGWNGIGFEKECHWILNLKKNVIGLGRRTFANQWCPNLL